MASPSILELSQSVATNTSIFHDYLTAEGLPLPSHEPSIPPPPLNLPSEIAAARDAAIQASYDLYELLIGPYGILLNGMFQNSRMLALEFIHTHKIGQSLGQNNVTTFKDIAKSSNLDEDDTRRMLRLAMTNRIFREPEPGVVAHSAASHVLATNPFVAAWAGVATKENWPAFQRTTEALTKWPGSQDPLKTAFSLAHNFTDLPFVEWEKDPPRAKQFSNAMKFLNAGAQPEMILSAIDYPFSTKNKVTFIDVGGSHGVAAIALAEKHPQLSCIVQDFPNVIQGADAQLPEHLRGRVKYMAHDFWTEQVVKGADIYFFRWIFHDWSDEYAIRILRQTVPALKEGARIIINDACIPPPGVLTTKQEMDLRTVDILMKVFTNAKECEAGDWHALFEKADSRFRFLGITTPPSARDSIIQAEWCPAAESGSVIS
ncbi:S-adenosyl-L-methionine-dependent methyltransferase [Periconia macrospinosa]|uniref:S-adenosyl-L-methionine-dependent methyltransferase n=1 Tax=Periconia macrospinosa TaxID=97972 RepID=A0A2V1DD33_9PLEO|nr:S-adenosyl-L-methionine-dependent methyltransferase [Periconia macrospinosa]